MLASGLHVSIEPVVALAGGQMGLGTGGGVDDAVLFAAQEGRVGARVDFDEGGVREAPPAPILGGRNRKPHPGPLLPQGEGAGQKESEGGRGKQRSYYGLQCILNGPPFVSGGRAGRVEPCLT